MASLDVLDSLFAVEREAEELVSAARAESERRIAAAQAEATRELGVALEAAAAEAGRRRHAALELVECECRQALDSYSRELAELPLDEESFLLACERALRDGSP